MWSRQPFITSVSHADSLIPRSSYPTPPTPNVWRFGVRGSHVAVGPESLFLKMYVVSIGGGQKTCAIREVI
jgi:hypothetical protein